MKRLHFIGIFLVIASIGTVFTADAKRKSFSGWSRQVEVPELNIKMKMRSLSKPETENLFEGRGAWLLRRRKPILPIEVVMRNTFDQDIVVNATEILQRAKGSLPELRDVSTIINKPKKNTLRFITLGILGTVGFGIVSGYILYAVGFSIAVISGAAASDCWMPFMVGAYSVVPAICAAPAAGYVLASKYSIIPTQPYAGIPQNQTISLKPGQEFKFLVFATKASLC